MIKPNQLALSDATEWLGHWHPLAEQLGSAEGLVELGSLSRFLRLPPVRNAASLRLFLFKYRTELLLAFELPAIQAAYHHAAGNEVRELVALDQELAAEAGLQTFSAPSRRIGQAQLQKLRPLRDQRVVQRYLAAVEVGEANGWHMLVYGLTLAIYSLPLRQGLLGYAHQMLRGFIYSAAVMLRLSETRCRGLFDIVSAGLPDDVDHLLKEPALSA